jgi:hypothetical protein
VPVLLSFALAATKLCTVEDASIGLPAARLVSAPCPLRTTRLLSADSLPAASRARTKYSSDALAGCVSVNVVPVTVVTAVLLRYTV